jgi:hypothetical protein
MNGALDPAASLARAPLYRAAVQTDPRLGRRDVIGDRPQRGADGATNDVCERFETPRQGVLCVVVGHPDVADARRKTSRCLHPNRATRRQGRPFGPLSGVMATRRADWILRRGMFAADVSPGSAREWIPFESLTVFAGDRRAGWNQFADGRAGCHGSSGDRAEADAAPGAAPLLTPPAGVRDWRGVAAARPTISVGGNSEPGRLAG